MYNPCIFPNACLNMYSPSWIHVWLHSRIYIYSINYMYMLFYYPLSIEQKNQIFSPSLCSCSLFLTGGHPFQLAFMPIKPCTLLFYWTLYMLFQMAVWSLWKLKFEPKREQSRPSLACVWLFNSIWSLSYARRTKQGVSPEYCWVCPKNI